MKSFYFVSISCIFDTRKQTNNHLKHKTMRTTEAQLNNLVKDICDLTGLSNNKEQAIEKGQNQYLALDNASCYGGYRIVNINVIGGGHHGAFNFGSTYARVKASEMSTKLKGIIAGLEYKSKYGESGL